jgi:hypothetical protein
MKAKCIKDTFTSRSKKVTSRMADTNEMDVSYVNGVVFS